MADFPYDDSRCHDVPTSKVKQSAKEFRIATWRRVNVLDEVEVKTHLADGFPILIGMPVDQAFMDLKDDSVYHGLTGPSLGGHAMVVTGYDDDKGAFRLLNSWGTTWADDGRGWILYEAFRRTVREGYVVDDILRPGVADAPKLELETVVLAESPAGVKSVPRTTDNHHCPVNCEGEPTRTNYRLELLADDGTTLRNPQLRCAGGPCHGWNAILFVRLENEGRRVHASWDVWAMPTTWELTADQVRTVEVSRFTRKIEVGTEFTVVALTGAPPPRLTGHFPSGETFSFTAGQPTTNERIRFLDFQVHGPETIYRYTSE
jgi:hypothetical protein